MLADHTSLLVGTAPPRHSAWGTLGLGHQRLQPRTAGAQRLGRGRPVQRVG